MKASELTGNARELKSKILNSKKTKFYIDSPISFNRIKISKLEASDSVFDNLFSQLFFTDCKDGILIIRKQSN